MYRYSMYLSLVPIHPHRQNKQVQCPLLITLALQGIMWLKWTLTYCSQASYVLKVDDDIFVNIFNLVTHIRTTNELGVKLYNTILCLVWREMKVVHNDTTNKWFANGTFVCTYITVNVEHYLQNNPLKYGVITKLDLNYF